MRLAVQYTTSYRYSQPARQVIQLLRLTPRASPARRCSTGESMWTWTPGCAKAATATATSPTWCYIDKPVSDLTVSVSGRVMTEDRAGVIEGVSRRLPRQVFLRETPTHPCGPGAARPRLGARGAGGNGAGEDAPAHVGDPRANGVRDLGNRHRYDRPGSFRCGPRRLPGFLPHLHRRRPSLGIPRATSPAICSGATGRCCRKRLTPGRGMDRGSGLGRVRPVQRNLGGRGLYPGGRGARLSRCGALRGSAQGRRDGGAFGRGAG
jgi:hypothetical protein